MYAEYYNLKAMPFQLTPDSNFFFESEEHKRAFAHLVYGLAQEEGFITITGEIGAGKTMLVERLWSQLDVQKFVAVRVSTTNVSGDDLLRLLASDLGLPAGVSDKANLLRRLEELFSRVISAGKRCLLVIDEVQNLPIAALEELRMLSNMTVHGRAPFQGLLLGQPQFREMLSDPRLEQLEQRVLASYHLGPLSAQDTKGYVRHRLTTAGWSGDPSFEDGAFGAIHRHFHVALDMAHRDAVGDQRLLERIGAADHERDEIVTPPCRHVAGFIDQRAILPHSIGRQIGADVEVGAECRHVRVADVGDADDRARLGVRLAEPQEIRRESRRQDREVALHEPGRDAAGRAMQCVAPAGEPGVAAGTKLRKRRIGRNDGDVHDPPVAKGMAIEAPAIHHVQSCLRIDFDKIDLSRGPPSRRAIQ